MSEYTEKLVASLRMEAQAAETQLPGLLPRDENLALLGRKFAAAADEIERLAQESTMTERYYTVGEIDALRRAVENKWLFGTYGQQQYSGFSRSYTEQEKTRCVEELVRTHMLAGHTAQDLYASETPAQPA